MPKFKHNMKAESKRINRLKGSLEDRLTAGMMRALDEVGRTAADDWLHGPRPEKLGIGKTGHLIQAVQGGHSFGGGIKTTGSASVSYKEGWRKSWKAGRFVHGEIGVDVKTKDGNDFDYGEYWEVRGTKHGGPRPFLNPAGMQAKSSGLLDRAIQIELNKVKLD